MRERKAAAGQRSDSDPLNFLSIRFSAAEAAGLQPSEVCDGGKPEKKNTLPASPGLDLFSCVDEQLNRSA